MTRAEMARFTVGGFLLVGLRGFLLWLFLPAALIVWPLAAIVALITRRVWVSPRTCLRFADDLLTSGLSNTVLRPLLGPAPWPWRPGGRGTGGHALLGMW